MNWCELVNPKHVDDDNEVFNTSGETVIDTQNYNTCQTEYIDQTWKMKAFVDEMWEQINLQEFNIKIMEHELNNKTNPSALSLSESTNM